jgi:peroxisomal 2,4-dienoyl-CoA reductase
MTSPFNPDLMKNKTCLITGGGSGIGLGIARQFVAHGGRVVITGRREGPLKQACQELGPASTYIAGDVRDPAQCELMVAKAVSSFGGVDVLVNNAAGNFVTAMEDLSPNALKTVLDIDFHGSFNMAKAALPELKKTRGLVVAISATLYYKAQPFQMHAAAAKASIDVMTNSIGVEWAAEHGVRAVSVAPGPIEGTVGGPTGRVFGRQGKSAFGEDGLSHIVPVGRFGTVDDIGYTVLFLASQGGSFINATTIVVDGGCVARMRVCVCVWLTCWRPDIGTRRRAGSCKAGKWSRRSRKRKSTSSRAESRQSCEASK